MVREPVFPEVGEDGLVGWITAVDTREPHRVELTRGDKSGEARSQSGQDTGIKGERQQ